MAYLLFHNCQFPHCHQVAQLAFRGEVAFQAELPLVLVEVRQFLSASSVSVDNWLCYFGIEGSRPYDCYKPLPGDFLSQPSPLYAQDT